MLFRKKHSERLDRRVTILALVWCINVFAFSIIYPFLPIYFHTIRKMPMSLVGQIFLFIGLGRIVSPMVSGWLIDTVGRRTILIVGPLLRSITFFILALLAFIQAPFYAFAALLFINSFFGQFFQNASDAYVSDIVAYDKRSEAFSLIRVGLNLGWMIGPAIGAFLSQTPFSLIFLITGIVCIMGVVIVYIYCPETLTHNVSRRRAEDSSRFQWVRQIKPRLAWHFFFSFFLFLMTSQLASTLSVFAVNLPAIDKNGVGFLYTINGLIIILFQVPINRYLGSSNTGLRMFLGAILYVIGYASVGFGSLWIHLAISVTIFTFGETLTEPVVVGMVSKLSDAEKMGRMMGLYSLVRGIGYSVGPYVGSLMYENLSSRPVLLWSLLASSALFAACGFFAVHREKKVYEVSR